MTKKRLREIDIYRIEKIKEGMMFTWNDIALFLGVGIAQLSRYRAGGKLPAFRFYAFQQALLARTEERARKEREQILKLFT